MTPRRIVIIGAGQAGFSLAASLRAQGYDGALTLIGDEPHLPYQRPPLSKAYLRGEVLPENLLLRPPGFYTQQGITVLTGCRAQRIDRAARQVITADLVLPYDLLALATGSTPIALPPEIGGGLTGIHTIRNIADIDRLASGFAPGARLMVIGGGYVGLEVAAVARKTGLEVTVVEQADRLLKRVAAEQTADYFRALHESHGVSIRTGTSVARLTGPARVQAAVLTDGARQPVDLVVAGIGARAETGLAAAAGLALGRGIITDRQGRSSDPAIFAVGDCAEFPHQGDSIRLESVPHAIRHAEAAAAAMLGGTAPYVATPWFWSDQYDVKLQIAGLNTGYTHTVLRKGAGVAQSVWYFRDHRLIAVDAMNDPAGFMTGRRWIEAGQSPAAALLADSGTPLRAISAETAGAA